jgi:hypothetical protein
MVQLIYHTVTGVISLRLIYGLCADSRPSVSYKSKTRNHQLRMQFIVELQSQYSSYCDTIGLYWIVPVFGITPIRGRCSMAMVSGRSIVNSTCCCRISFLSNASIPSHSIISHLPTEQHRCGQCIDQPVSSMIDAA